MERVFPLGWGEASPPRGSGVLNRFAALAGSAKVGVVEKVVGPGTYVIRMDDGGLVEARGPRTLKLGSPVSVTAPAESAKVLGSTADAAVSNREAAEGLQWFALIPLAFGGKKAAARLDVYVEKEKEGTRTKVDPAIYFVFTIQTEECGEIQWSIHLKGRQVTLHVFARPGDGKKGFLNQMILEIEAALNKRGFVLTAPALLLNRPFKVPTGFRLNVRG